MNTMAVHATLLRAPLDHVPRIGVDVAVGGIKSGIVGALEIDLEVGKQIVAHYEIIGIGQAAGLGAPAAQVTLAAGRNDFAWIARAFRPQQSKLGIGGVLLLDVTVAGITIEGKRRKAVRLRIDARGVASGALSSEDIGLPGLAIVR